MGYIYLITNKINGKQYVGQTICKDINERWKKHKQVDKHSLGNYIYNAYMKYGTNNFKFQIICICFDEDSNNYEEYYIKKYNTIVPNGYNLKEGGNNLHHHPETIKLISNKLKGRKLSNEQIEKMRISMKGKKHSEETKQKIREKTKLYMKNNENIKKIYSEKFKGKKMDENVKQRMYENMTEENKIRKNKNLLKGSEKMKKQVNQYSKDNIFIKSFNSITEASKETATDYNSLSSVCNNKKGYKTAGGFIWKFM